MLFGAHVNRRWIIVASVLLARPAVADDAPQRTDDPGSTPEQVAIDPARPPRPEPTRRTPTREPSAADVVGAPRPGQESGRLDEVEGEPGIARRFGRTVLFVPRAFFEIAFAPVRGSMWAYDRFEVRERWMRIFFNDARTIGIYPTLGITSDYGVDLGARFVARELFGHREDFSLRASMGQSNRAIVRGALRSGDRFGAVRLTLAGEYELRSKDRFYGIGNSDEVDVIPMMIDPLVDRTAVETRYEQELVRSSLIVDTHVASALHLRASGALTDLSFGPGESGTPIDRVYIPERIVGFDGVRHAYGELELLWDSRRRYSRWDSGGIHTVGSFVSVYAGRTAVEDRPDFWRVGGDLQQFIRLGLGPRTLVARLHAEAVSGSIDEVPFDELPKLGGSRLLRGYSSDRFRDRAAALGTLEYGWDLSRFLLAKIFVDAGRVAPSVSDLSTEGDLRIGYGVGFEGYTEKSFIVRAHVASSVDGGLFFTLSFDPWFDLNPRVERR